MKMSYWEMGRADGRFVSMTEIGPPARCSVVAPLGLPLQTLQTAFAAALWYEVHRCRQLSEAQFEERRVRWLGDHLEKWIQIHSESSSLDLELTARLGVEATKLIKQMEKNDLLDIPQLFALQCRHIAQRFHLAARAYSQVLNALVQKSGSSTDWLMQPTPTPKEAAKSTIEEALHFNTSTGRKALVVACGLAALIPPISGFAIGYGGAAFIDVLFAMRGKGKANRLSRNPEVLELAIGVNQLLAAEGVLSRFLAEQKLPAGRRIVVVAGGKGSAELSIASAGRRRIAKPPAPLKVALRSLNSPLESQKTTGK